VHEQKDGVCNSTLFERLIITHWTDSCHNSCRENHFQNNCCNAVQWSCCKRWM